MVCQSEKIMWGMASAHVFWFCVLCVFRGTEQDRHDIQLRGKELTDKMTCTTNQLDWTGAHSHVSAKDKKPLRRVSYGNECVHVEATSLFKCQMTHMSHMPQYATWETGPQKTW